MKSSLSRRQLIRHLSIGSALCSCLPTALYSAIKKPSTVDQNRAFDAPSRYFHARYDNHCQNFFDFEKALSTPEKDWLKSCFNAADHWYHPVNGRMDHSIVSFSHQIHNNQSNASRIYAGAYTQPERLYPQLVKLLRHRGINPQHLPLMNKPVGLGWDVERDHFKVYAFFNDYRAIPDIEIQQLSQLLNGAPIYPQAIASWTWSGDHTLHEKKLYLGLTNDQEVHTFGSAIRHTTAMLTSKRGLVPQLDIQSSRDIPLNQTAKDIIKHHQQNDISLDTLTWENNQQHVLYFS